MLNIQTPDQVTREIEEKRMASQQASLGVLAQYEQPQFANVLAGMVRNDWSTAKTHRNSSGLNERLLNCLRRRKGEYPKQKLADLKLAQGSTIYMRIVASKCRTAKAIIADLYAQSGDRSFSLEPTPVPDLPADIEMKLVTEAQRGIQSMGVPQEQVSALLEKHRARLRDEIKKEVEERTDRMADHIEDLMVESGFRATFSAFIDDFVTYPAAIMKGLEFHKAKSLQWVDQGGRVRPIPSEKVIPRVRRISPFRAYPSPATTDSVSGHWFIEHITFTPKDLANMRGVQGYNTEALAHVLNQYSSGGLREWVWSETERADLEGRSSMLTEKGGEIDGLEWTGDVSGQELIDSGIDLGEELDPVERYPVSILVIGSFVVRAVMNFDPTGDSDIMHACWETVPGSFWGEALPEVLADTEDACNGAARSLMQNMSMASGAQVGVDLAAAAPGQDYDSIYPWKIWKFDSSAVDAGRGRDPVYFFQVASNANELMGVYERFVRFGDEICGLPSYAAGSDSGAGAAKTFRGLNMLMNASSKNIKQVVRNIDQGAIEKVVKKHYNYLMLTHPDNAIKADAIPRARGSDTLIHKEEQAVKQQEFMDRTLNPIDSQIIDMGGRREMLEQAAKSVGMPVDRIIPSAEELADKMKAQAKAQAQAQVQPGPQPEQAR